MQAVDLPAALIYPPTEARSLDRAKVAAIAESIGEVGLINPIIVKKAMKIRNGQQAEAWEIIAGNHRYEACAVTLKMQTIPCVVSDAEALINEMIMIDENLCRSELSPSDRAKYTARRKELYEMAHPETAHGGDRRSDQVAKSATRSFADNTASAIGSSPRAVRLDAERGEKVTEEALGLIRGTDLDTGTYLDKLKKLSPNDQVAAIQRDLVLGRRRAREEAARKEADRSNKETDRVIAMTEAEHFAGWIMARVDLNELPTIISWIEGTKPKDVIAALRRQAA